MRDSFPATPLPNTYWVLPGRLLAGEHPFGADERDARERLSLLGNAGMDYFIDLTEPGERPDYSGLLPGHTTYWRSAIPDTWIPDSPSQMFELQARLSDALSSDRGIYVHCRAGIGRTGMVIGCFLAQIDGNGEAALKRLNRLWRQSKRSKTWPKVPQTAEQADYIRGWAQRRKSALSQGIDS